MILGSDDGSVDAVALDGLIDVESDGATTMLGDTVNEVALSVPVGLILCGALLVVMPTSGDFVLLVEGPEPEAVPDVVSTPVAESVP